MDNAPGDDAEEGLKGKVGYQATAADASNRAPGAGNDTETTECAEWCAPCNLLNSRELRGFREIRPPDDRTCYYDD